MILELAYYNNPRQPISLKELRGRLKEFVNVDFFFFLRSESEEGLIWNKSWNKSREGGYPILETRRNIARANKRNALSELHETSSFSTV